MPLAGCVGLLAVVVAGERVPWFPQVVKYGAIGVIATYIQASVFYLLCSTCLMCLGAGDWAVCRLGLPSAAVSDGVRAVRFAVATSAGFVVANVVCWLLNRWFVFRPGKFRWHVELALFFGTATFATVLALAISSALIRFAGLMTTIALAIEVVVSFLVNFFVRKFFIFRG